MPPDFMSSLAQLGTGIGAALGGGGEPSKTTQQITNKATGNVVKSINVGNVKTVTKSKSKSGKAVADNDGQGGFASTPVLMLAVMVFVLVLVSIVALLGR